MKGHLVERSPGHWAIVLEIRDPESGKRKRKWHSFAGGRRAAARSALQHHPATFVSFRLQHCGAVRLCRSNATSTCARASIRRRC